MSYAARIMADSISNVGVRATTLELTYPRIIHSEFMTHKVFSKNASSSRAIPINTFINKVTDDPFIPVYWGKNQKTMQASVELSESEISEALKVWFEARDNAITSVRKLEKIGVHKQISNRLLEPWMYITVLVTGVEFNNFFNLRCDSNAQPEIRRIAEMVADLYFNNDPQYLKPGDWHIPMIQSEDDGLTLEIKKKISVARCARVSYLNHNGTRDIQKDIDFHDDLMGNGHMSPFEHVLRAITPYQDFMGNIFTFADMTRGSNFYRAWKQYRKDIKNENRIHFDYDEYKRKISA